MAGNCGAASGTEAVRLTISKETRQPHSYDELNSATTSVFERGAWAPVLPTPWAGNPANLCLGCDLRNCEIISVG